jgi:hypothetical protein
MKTVETKATIPTIKTTIKCTRAPHLKGDKAANSFVSCSFCCLEHDTYRDLPGETKIEGGNRDQVVAEISTRKTMVGNKFRMNKNSTSKGR